jgi:DNA repair protein RadC
MDKTSPPPNTAHSTIRSWSEDDRPREKLLQKGRQALTDAELVAILLGSGSRGESAVALAQRILRSADNNLHDLGKKSVKELQLHKGMGEAKSLTLIAALELGRRRQLSDLRERPRINSSQDSYKAIAPLVNDLNHEEFWLLLLNRNNEIISRERLSMGGTAGTVVDIKIIFKIAIEARATAFIAVHNHPSGNLNPSHADEVLTKKLAEASKILDIPLLDHLIISERGYYSFRDHDKM